MKKIIYSQTTYGFIDVDVTNGSFKPSYNDSMFTFYENALREYANFIGFGLNGYTYKKNQFVKNPSIVFDNGQSSFSVKNAKTFNIPQDREDSTLIKFIEQSDLKKHELRIKEIPDTAPYEISYEYDNDQGFFREIIVPVRHDWSEYD